MTIIFKRHHRLPDGQLCHAGDEVPPGLLEPDVVNSLFDSDIVVESPSRLSYFALLKSFAGAEASTEQLDVASMFPALAIPGQKSDKVSPS
jgi:hypothetical protein